MSKHRYSRKTPQEVMLDFPIGTVINWGSERHLRWEYIDKVEGYIFDGEYWYPAEVTWDGWQPFFGDDEDEETYEPPLDPDLEWMRNL